MSEQNPKIATVAAATIAMSLLESNLEFHNTLLPGEDTLTLYGGGRGPGETPIGTLELWWGCQLDVRGYGIKDISVYITRMVLSGHYEDESGNMTGEEFHVAWPPGQADHYEIGADVDAPSKGNIEFLVTPKWTVKHRLKDRDSGQTFSLLPVADVDFDRHTIEIEF